MFSAKFLEEVSQWAKNIGQGATLSLPFLVLLGAMIVILGLDFFYKNNPKNNHLLVNISAFFLILNIVAWSFFMDKNFNYSFYNKTIYTNFFITLTQILTSVVTLVALVLVYSFGQSGKNGQKNYLGQYIAGWFGVLLGGQIAISTQHFLVLYLGFELMGIGAYFLSAYTFTQKSAENSLKYLLFGIFATAIMLYGMSWIYGLAGGLYFEDLKNVHQNAINQNAINQNNISQNTVFLAIFFVSIGFLLKIAAIPVHFWTVEIYETAPISLVAFISNVPKIAGIFAFLQFLGHILPQDRELLLRFLAIIAIITLTFGNFMAMREGNVRRMFAFSAIAQAGFLLFPLLFFTQKNQENITPILFFYVLVYSLANVAVWLGLELLNDAETTQTLNTNENAPTKNNKIVKNIPQKTYNFSNYAGMGLRYPLLSGGFCVLMLALAGLPPTGMFWGKFFIFSGLWSLQNGDTLWLLVFLGAIFNTLFAFAYYFKLPYYLFFREQGEGCGEQGRNWGVILGYWFCVVLVLVLFFFPNLVVNG